MPRSRSTSDYGARTSPPAAPMPRCSAARASSSSEADAAAIDEGSPRSPRRSARASWSRIRARRHPHACRASPAELIGEPRAAAHRALAQRPGRDRFQIVRARRDRRGDRRDRRARTRCSTAPKSMPRRVMPGFTHLQSGQPVTLGHHLLAYREMLVRDRSRFADARADERIAARQRGAGRHRLPDRPRRTAQALGFDRPTANSLDAVSDRDFVVDYPPRRRAHLRGASVAAGRGDHPVGVAAVRLRRCPTPGRPDRRSCPTSATPTPPSWCAAIRRGSSATWSPCCWCC
jgi:hypothetical protein